jgi:hypothetical protein
MKVVIHVAKTRQKNIRKHRLRARPRVHHAARKIVDVFWVREVRAEGMELVAQSLDALFIKRTGRDSEVVATLTKTGAQCKNWVQVAICTPS